MIDLKEYIDKEKFIEIDETSNVSLKSFLIYQLVKESDKTILLISRDKEYSKILITNLSQYIPKHNILYFPAWNTNPYDTNSPDPRIMGERIETIIRSQEKNKIIITEIPALLQKIPPAEIYAKYTITLTETFEYSQQKLVTQLTNMNYKKTSEVTTVGEFAQRGGIIDLYTPNYEYPIRIDYFGDTIERLMFFNPINQQSLKTTNEVKIIPHSEVLINSNTIKNFRNNYLNKTKNFDKTTPLYASISDGIKYPGMEYFLPFFYNLAIKSLISLLEKDTLITITYDGIYKQIDEVYKLIKYYYNERLKLDETNVLSYKYNPLPINELYIENVDLKNHVNQSQVVNFTLQKTKNVVSLSSCQVKTFLDLKLKDQNEFYNKYLNYINKLKKENASIIISAENEYYFEKISDLLNDYKIPFHPIKNINLEKISKTPDIYLTIKPIQKSFMFNHLVFISDNDLLRKNHFKQRLKSKKTSSEEFIEDISSLKIGDLIVHYEHGIGKFAGLTTLELNNLNKDFIKILYANDDKLLVPVENLDALSRYSASSLSAEFAELDKLGGVNWQKRKAKIKNKIREIAYKLLKNAAKRELSKAPKLQIEKETLTIFSNKFNYIETDDQSTAIDAVINDLAKTTPMDRLICGDVGFGKTEVAMRAAFVAAYCGYQVAILTPTTLLAKQHYNNFTSRFSDYKNIKIAELSRFKTTKEAKEIKENLQKGEVSIVIGTHALLSKTVKFKNLGLLIIDEEQRFGVEHKEKLKTISENVHVLTLTATPIPRTLQLSLSGIKELSLITTPPINRKPIDTYITNKDFLLIKDILIRELSRGGQIFYVTPRIKQINQIYEKLSQLLPELKIAIANGQMPSKQLEKVINDFTNKKHNLLLSTNIIESGIDIPSVNTLIVNRPDLFGLAELYQLRGRIGRSTEKAYCYLLLDETHSLKPNTKKKLEIIKQMDYLGAGFKIASYDLDMRGAGNLLGEEQSGHIKEVGIELYNHMLEDTIKRLKSEQKSEIEKKTSSYTLHEYSPEIITNLNARIPNNYIKDSDVRLEIYTKISKLYNKSMIYDFKKELRDRFGEYPNEVDNLLYISELKLKCWDLNVNKLSVGSKGVLIGFYKNSPKNPEKLLNYITQNANLFKIKSEGELMYLKPPHKETYKQDLSKILNLLNNVIFEGNAT